MKPWIVIPAHNRRELTLACLRQLAARGELEKHSVLVVDDGSMDDTGAAVSREFPGVGILRGGGDLWWTGAIAAGMAHAFARGATAVCWLNDDCLPEAGTLATIAEYAAAHLGQIVAPVCVADSTNEPVTTAFIGRRALATSEAPALPVDGVSGFCVWVSREIWSRTGLPDATRFPHYYGDTAYMLQARRAGCHAALLTSCRARLMHYVPRSTNVRDFVARAPDRRASWPATFVSPRSPFRLATQFHYLRLRYGVWLGTALALARSARWQAAWCAARLTSPQPLARS